MLNKLLVRRIKFHSRRQSKPILKKEREKGKCINDEEHI